jgi:ribosome-associated translation inhibitor RaiA
MHIEVSSETGSVTKELQVYAEYRLFSAVGRLASRIESITVHVRDNDTVVSGAGATCAITAQLSPAGCVQTRCTGPHPAAAIDRATERVARAIATKLSNRPLRRAQIQPRLRRRRKSPGNSA